MKFGERFCCRLNNNIVLFSVLFIELICKIIVLLFVILNIIIGCISLIKFIEFMCGFRKFFLGGV